MTASTTGEPTGDALREILVDLGESSYPIWIGRDWLDELAGRVRSRLRGRRLVLISNPDIAREWGEKVEAALRGTGLEVDRLDVPEGERHKSLETVSNIYDFLLERRYERSVAIAALGGGVVGDTVGFAAATYLRGVDLVQLPTSLLAMVDSSVGGKTGVNHPRGKNLIGAFKQPICVGIDVAFLDTLSDAELKAGLAEIVKYGMIEDDALFAFLEEHADAILERDGSALVHIITRSCEIKARVVEQDEREAGLRAILNFGHTFGHAAEALLDYRDMRHGEAVAAGMVAAARLGERIGNVPAESTERLARLLERFGLPTALPEFPVEDYVSRMRSDKKVREGRMRFIVPKRIGEVEIRDDIDEAIVGEVLAESF